MNYNKIDLFDRLRVIKHLNKSIGNIGDLNRCLNGFSFHLLNIEEDLYFIYKNKKFKLTTSLKVRYVKNTEEIYTVICNILETKIRKTYDILCNEK